MPPWARRSSARLLNEAALPLMELAHHALEAGGDLPRAADLAVRAAARAAAIAATDQAIAILERAAAALDATGAPAAAARAHSARARRGAHPRGRLGAGHVACCEVATIAERAGDARAAGARRADLRAGVEASPSSIRCMVDLLESALAALPPGDSPLRARLLARLAAALQPSADIEEPVRLAREAIATARRLGDRRGLLETMFDGLSAMMDVVEPRERHALNLEVEALARAARRSRAPAAHTRATGAGPSGPGRDARSPTPASTRSRRWPRSCARPGSLARSAVPRGARRRSRGASPRPRRWRRRRAQATAACAIRWASER